MSKKDEEGSTTVGEAPLALMQQIARELYLSTPGLEKDMPIKDSKIFSSKDLFQKPKLRSIPSLIENKAKKDWVTMAEEMKAQADE